MTNMLRQLVILSDRLNLYNKQAANFIDGIIKSANDDDQNWDEFFVDTEPSHEKIATLKLELAEEKYTLARLEDSLKNFQPTDKSGWTHYDYANFQGVSKPDISAAIYRVKSRIEYIKSKIIEAEHPNNGLFY